MGQFDAHLQKGINHEGHEVTRRLAGKGFPLCTFVPFVVKTGFARN